MTWLKKKEAVWPLEEAIDILRDTMEAGFACLQANVDKVILLRYKFKFNIEKIKKECNMN